MSIWGANYIWFVEESVSAFTSVPFTSVGLWNQITWTYSAGTNNIYLNGSLVKTIQYVFAGSYTGQYYISDPTVPVDGSIDDVRVYSSALSSSDIQKQNYHVRGVKTFRTLLRPEVTGTLTVPPLAYSYFDPKTEHYEHVQIPAQHLQVGAGDAPTQAFPAQGFVSSPEQSAPGVKVMANDIRYLKLQVPVTGQQKSFPQEVWIIGFVFPPIVLFLVWFWRRYKDKLDSDPVYARKIAAGRSARAALHQAHLARNHKDSKVFYASLSLSLTGYLADKLGLSRSGVTQREIIGRLIKAGAEPKKISQLTELLDECDFARRSAGAARRLANSLESSCYAYRLPGVFFRHQRRHAARRLGGCGRSLRLL